MPCKLININMLICCRNTPLGSHLMVIVFPISEFSLCQAKMYCLRLHVVSSTQAGYVKSTHTVRFKYSTQENASENVKDTETTIKITKSEIKTELVLQSLKKSKLK